MSLGWESKTLGELLRPMKSIDPRMEPERIFKYVDVSSVCRDCCKIVDASELKGYEAPSRARRLIEVGDVLFATIRPTLKRVAIVPQRFDGEVCSTGYYVMKPVDALDKRYLFHFLFTKQFQGEMESRQKGASYPAVNNEDIIEQVIPLPPLPEQKRIVAILDEVFAAIEKAKENAARNLANARELFDSYLNSIFKELWDKGGLVCMSDLATDITDGDHNAPPKSDSGVPFITISNIDKTTKRIDFTDTFSVPQEYFDNLKPNRKPLRNDVLFTVTGSFGIPVLVEHDQQFCFQRHIGLIRPRETVVPKWLYYLCLTPQVFDQANERATGTAQKTVSLKVLRSLRVPKADLQTQSAAVQLLDKLSNDTAQLARIYSQKLIALNELKQSILHKAFAGQLTKHDSHPITAAIFASHSGISLSTTDLHAGVLALASLSHESLTRNKPHFGHVKGEKISHMVEYVAGVDLGRNPIKDGMGPNDFQHLKKVESSAEKAGYFLVSRETDRYTLKRLARFDELIAKTRVYLGVRLEAVQKILDLMSPLTTRQAEILATTYAAWNNLLITGQLCTEDAIVTEARENWHEAKLKIPREKFAKAIGWIVQKEIAPTGKGKLVVAKPSPKH